MTCAHLVRLVVFFTFLAVLTVPLWYGDIAAQVGRMSTQAEQALQRFLPILMTPTTCSSGKSPTYVNGAWTCSAASLATNSTPQVAALGIGGASGGANTLKVYGVTSGSVTLAVPAIAGTSTLTLPAGTTDLSATGGASQVVKQATAGAPLTVGQLTTADISGFTQPLTGTTGSIGGSILIAGACASGTVSVTNATTDMVASASPNTYPGDGVVWTAQVTSAGTVTVKVCAIIGLTPSSSTYNIRAH